MSKATEQRVKQNLKFISKELRIPFNVLLDTLFLERFLTRISKSSHKENLIFKGGMCLAQLIDLRRETKDIDFLLTGKRIDKNKIQSILSEISSIDVGDDFVFSLPQISELSIEHKKYPGYRVKMHGKLGQIINKVSIDIGTGDVVRPRLLFVELMKSKKPLFEENIDLQSYPPEYIFSEKLEAILYLGELNSRMKDFYDCYQLLQEQTIDDIILKKAVNETFINRETKLERIPEDITVFKSRWAAFLRKNKIKSLELSEIVKELNNKIDKVLNNGSSNLMVEG